MKRPRPGQIVVIEWADICSDCTWLNGEEQRAFAPGRCRAVGIVLSCDQKVLKLAHNVCLDDGRSDVSVYPIGVVQKVKVLANG